MIDDRKYNCYLVSRCPARCQDGGVPHRLVRSRQAMAAALRYEVLSARCEIY